MTNRLRLSWSKSLKGYELVQHDPSSVDLDILKNDKMKARHGTLPPPKPMPHTVRGRRVQKLGDEDLAWFSEISPLGNRVQEFDPINKSPDLYLLFANLPLSANGILNFAKDNGLLGTGHAHETIGEWRYEIRRMQDAIWSWKASGVNKSTKFPTSLLRHTLEQNLSGKIEQYLEPENLLAAIWVQFAGAIEGETSFIPCVECSNWIAVAPGSNRPDKIYCSDACKMRAYRKRKAKKVKK